MSFLKLEQTATQMPQGHVILYIIMASPLHAESLFLYIFH